MCMIESIKYIYEKTHYFSYTLHSELENDDIRINITDIYSNFFRNLKL